MKRFGRGRPWSLALVVLAVGVSGLALSGCVADPPPIIGTAVFAGADQAVVSWQPPPAAPAPISAYVVTPWIGSDRQTSDVFNSTATTQTVTGLTNGVSYTFTVHAVNADGNDSAESGMSNPVVPSPAVNVVPNPGFEQGGCGSTPVICGWQGYGMFQSSGRTGGYSLMLSPCSGAGCLGNPSLLADTDPAVSCAAIGAGTHPASFWYIGYLGDDATVDLAATFFQGSDCTGAHEWQSIGADVSGFTTGWQQVTGDVNAPAGTQSAVFELRANSNLDCSDYCWPSVAFDDLAVYQYE